MNRTSSPPTENGERLATLERGPDEQLRVNWCEYKGSPFLSLRIWTRDRAGNWWPSREKGLTVRIRELDQVAAAIAEATTLAEAHSAQRRGPGSSAPTSAVRSMPPGRGRISGAYKRPSPPVPSAEFEPFSEF